MNKKYVIITIAVIIVIIGIIVIGNLNKENVKENDNLKIVTSFYPMYIMTMNITNGVEDVQVSNMAENYVGCIHDYTLKTEDLKKFENESRPGGPGPDPAGFGRGGGRHPSDHCGH